MSNYTETKQEVKNYIVARTPLVVISSSERERCERMLSAISRENGFEMLYYTDSRQVTQLGQDSKSVNVENDPLAFIADVFRKKRKSTFIYGDVKRISDDTIYSRELINVLYLAKESDSTLILITNDSVFSRILQFGMIVKLDHPDLDERIEQIKKFVETYGSRFTIDWKEEDILRAANLLRGFTEIQIDNILCNELIASEGLFVRNIFRLTSQKSRLYSPVSSVQEVEVARELCVSGLDNLKDWLAEKKKIFFASDEQLEHYSLETPKGILLAGVPGCGKSYSAKMVAKEWELPLYRFDIGSVYDKWMGESERKMSEALEFIDNVSPCILWIDEIEKALSTSDSSNDTSQRIMGKFLFWLQESKSRVFMVATANDITKLPAELFRKGRFSEIFFVDLPSAEERKMAVSQYAKKCLHLNFNEVQLNELVQLSEGFSFSEIEYAIKEVAYLLLIYGNSGISMDIIRERFNKVVPIEVSNPEKVNKIREWGRQKAVPAQRKECVPV
ncbi:MAG: AAA family ATPase [Ruminococcus sp.]|nr:AAA family ATPase [Ruminococcus sp.]